MLPIFWNAAALDDLAKITDYIAEFSAHAAIDMHEQIQWRLASRHAGS